MELLCFNRLVGRELFKVGLIGVFEGSVLFQKSLDFGLELVVITVDFLSLDQCVRIEKHLLPCTGPGQDRVTLRDVGFVVYRGGMTRCFQ